MAEVPQIVEGQRLFGEPDYLLRVVSRDLAAYKLLYDSVLSKLPGLRVPNSTVVMKETLPRRPLPVPPHKAATPRRGS
ncbi:AsnC family transcriptional regulator [Intrasporangium chromatireducens Q5-1]|uniref:AsnC family transcriptional regulator n=1 Tax=Intrasporangium chromatireducens Q5-1 TaxID=584657 RepID=W9GQ12_9MICO|nr:AsnC family transcriptional regulator [Intrasporangium chromatireducens Q5-1]